MLYRILLKIQGLCSLQVGGNDVSSIITLSNAVIKVIDVVTDGLSLSLSAKCP